MQRLWNSHASRHRRRCHEQKEPSLPSSSLPLRPPAHECLKGESLRHASCPSSPDIQSLKLVSGILRHCWDVLQVSTVFLSCLWALSLLLFSAQILTWKWEIATHPSKMWESYCRALDFGCLVVASTAPPLHRPYNYVNYRSQPNGLWKSRWFTKVLCCILTEASKRHEGEHNF